jgi:hypothetical protein
MFGFLECVHILSFAVGVGTIAMVDFRLLGAGLKSHSPAQLARDTTFWTMGGLVLAVTSGLALFSTDPERYAANPSFRLKAICLAAAIVYNYTAHMWVARRRSETAIRAAAGALSLLLWIAVIFGGLFYAFT